MARAGLDITALAADIRGTGRVAVVGVGDDLDPVDRPGIDAARVIARERIDGVAVFCAGTVPESVTGPLRKFRPGHVIFLDAADMGARPGTLAVIGPVQISGSLVSTHVLPLSVVMEYVRQETGAGVTLIGIQPELSRAGNDLTAEDQTFLDRNLQLLAGILRERMDPD